VTSPGDSAFIPRMSNAATPPSPAPSPSPADRAAPAAGFPAFRAWLRRQLLRELKLSALFLALALAGVLGLGTLWSGFDTRWHSLNSQLTYAALEQHPTALLGQIGGRLADSEYGWGLFSWTEPFNVTAARERLRADFPEFAGLGPDGNPRLVRGSTRRRADPATAAARADTYVARVRHLEARRFSHLYRPPSPFDVPTATERLARIVTKALGLPDALLHLLRTLVTEGFGSILLASGSLGIAGAALWTSKRPARLGFKVLAWPLLAAALGWFTIILMSVGAAFFGALTPNTSALALFAGSPLLYLAAKSPLRLLEELALRPKPWDGTNRRNRPWDGVERRRRQEPPAPPPGGTVPPVGGA
jgi:hypothetical protein